MKNVPVSRIVKVLLVAALLALAPTACDSTGSTTYYGYSYGYGAPVGYPGAWHGGYYGPGYGYGGYGGGVVVVTGGPPIPY